MNISATHSWIAIKKCLRETKKLPFAWYPLGNTSQFSNPVLYKTIKRIKDITLTIQSFEDLPLDIHYPPIERCLGFSSLVTSKVYLFYHSAFQENQWSVFKQIFTNISITGTSISTPTTVARAAPDERPKSKTDVAMATSKWLEAPIMAEGRGRIRIIKTHQSGQTVCQPKDQIGLNKKRYGNPEYGQGVGYNNIAFKGKKKYQRNQ